MSATYVTLVPLVFRASEDDYVVGPQAGSDFVELPEIGALAVRALQVGHSLEEVSLLMAAHAGQEVDVHDFLSQIGELGWVESVGEEPPPAPRSARAVRTSPLVRALFSRTAWVAYGALAVLDVALLATGTVPLPSISALIETHTPAVVMVLAFLTSILTLVIHECWHLLAARASGVDASISVGRRWLTPVAQTDLSRMWLLPRRARFGPILAGPAIDGAMLAALLLLHATGLADGRVMELAVGVTVLGLLAGIGFQLQVYMRTDGYALLTTAFGCRNLSGIASARLRQVVRRSSDGDEAVLEHAHANDRKALPVYLAAISIGVAWSIWFFFAVGLPALASTIDFVVGASTKGGSTPDRIQALLIIALALFELGWLMLALLRERRARHRKRLHTHQFVQVDSSSSR